MYLSVEQVAKKMSVSTKTVYRMIHSGKLNAHKLSPRCIRISETDIEEFMKGGTHDRIKN